MLTFPSFDGASVAYQDRGAGPPVVLLHGLGADSAANWSGPGIVRALIAAGWRVVTMDWRGHGQSVITYEVAPDALWRDLVALLDHLHINHCAAVGYSMGARELGHLLSREPRIIAAVFAGMGDRMLVDREDQDAMIEEALLASSLERIPAAGRPFRHLADTVRADRCAVAAVHRSREPVPVASIRDTAIPVLVVAGDDDDIAGSPERLSAQIPGSVCLRIPGDHFTALNAPELAVAIIYFLASPPVQARFKARAPGAPPGRT